MAGRMTEPRIALPQRLPDAALLRRDPAFPVIELAGEGLGTTWRVLYVARVGVAPDRISAAIASRLGEIVAQMSQWEPASLLSRFNRAPAGTSFALHADFAAVLSAGLDIAGRTNGAFDPTHGCAAALLGFGAEPPAGPPSAATLDDALASAGWQQLAFDSRARSLRQPGGLWLDFSGIAKGYAVDAVADLLARHGIVDALVEIGGELVGRGLKPDCQPWWVDLETPPGAELPPLRVALYDGAVATSGDHVRGAHTLDPRTGRALPPRIASVSVIHDSAMLADAWATALTVLGPVAALATATREGLAARIVAREDGVLVETLSPQLRRLIDG